MNCYWTIDGEAPKDKLYRTGIVLLSDLSFNYQRISHLKNLISRLPGDEQKKIAEAIMAGSLQETPPTSVIQKIYAFIQRLFT